MTEARTKGKRVSGESSQITAEFFNDIVSVVDWFKAFRPAEQRGSKGSERRDSGIIKILNDDDGGADLAWLDVVGLTDPIFDPTDLNAKPEFKIRPALRGRVPTCSDVARFGVMIEPALNGQVGAAVCSGLVPVLVDIVDASHNFADIDPDNQDRLKSYASGSAQIITREDATTASVQWCIVRISNDSGVSCVSSSSTTGEGTSSEGTTQQGTTAEGTTGEGTTGEGTTGTTSEAECPPFDCSGSCKVELEVVTDVQCVDGEIQVTKATLCLDSDQVQTGGGGTTAGA